MRNLAALLILPMLLLHNSAALAQSVDASASVVRQQIDDASELFESGKH